MSILQSSYPITMANTSLWKLAGRLKYPILCTSANDVLPEEQCGFNCCFTVHFDKSKAFLPTNALFIKT
jgi:hypothetical protein